MFYLGVICRCMYFEAQFELKLKKVYKEYKLT